MVCYTHFHWFFNPECHHIFGKQTGYICTFSVSLIWAPQNNNNNFLDSFNISDECWFQNRSIGKDTLASFMSTLSKKTGLSQIYTNHSIRATGATILGRNCSMAQIMAVTGHKSASSVCSISTCFIKGKTSYGRHYHKFCSWRATISTILNNATAQYFPVATHAADTKQFKFNITCSNESQYTCFIVGYGRR